MRFDEWEPFYRSILEEFSFDRAADETAADWLAPRLSPRAKAVGAGWDALAARFIGKAVWVLGAADRAVEDLRRAPPASLLVAADGATSAALEAGRVPDLIVTDLDGRVEDQVAAVARGAFVAVHAHGDNRAAMEQWVGVFEPARLLGTCQCDPPSPLRNEGGFTDGDRACFLASSLGASELHLAGFDFTGRVGRFTGHYDPATKAGKLAWALRLLTELVARGAKVHGLPSEATSRTRAAPASWARHEGRAPGTGGSRGAAPQGRRRARRRS